MTYLFLPKLYHSNYEIVNIINENNNDLNLVVNFDVKFYKYLKHNKKKNLVLIFIEKKFLDKFLLKLSQRFKNTFFKFIIDSILSKRLFRRILKKINKYNVKEVFVDHCNNDYHGEIIKLFYQRGFLLNFLYLIEHPKDIKFIILNSFHFKKNFLNNLFFKFIFFINNSHSRCIVVKKNYYVSRFKLNQILFISFFKINYAHNFKRISYNFFKKIYCYNENISHYIIKNENLKKNSNVIVFKNTTKQKKIKIKYDFLLTTHPFTRTKQINDFRDELLLYKVIILKLKSLYPKRKITLYIHPNHSNYEKNSLFSFCKNNYVDYRNGGNLHEDINEFKCCITYFSSTVVITCNKLNVPFVKYNFSRNLFKGNKNKKVSLIFNNKIKKLDNINYKDLMSTRNTMFNNTRKVRYQYQIKKNFLKI